MISGLENLKGLDPERPTMAFSNHTNWWDGLIVFFLTRLAPKKDFYCMMEEKQLRHYKFFTWLGAFSIDLENPIRAAASLRYATRLLKKKRNLLWIFPQGKLVNPYTPIQVETGTHYLSQKVMQTQMLPVAFHYCFFREDRPHILIKIGKPFTALQSSQEKIQTAVQELVDSLHQAEKTGNLSEFTRAMTPRLAINKQWERVQLIFRGRWREFQPNN